MLNRVVEDHPIPTSVDSPGVPDPLKICLLGYRSNPYSGGQGIYMRYLSKALVEAGHQVDVISGPPYPELDERVKLIKLPSLNLFEQDSHILALKPRHLLSYTDFFEWFSMLTGGFAEPYTFGRRLQHYFQKNKPDYDIVHDNQSLCYGTLYLQENSVPLVTTIHHPITSDLEIALGNTDSWKLRLLIRRWHSFIRMQKKVVSKLNHIVTVSEQELLNAIQILFEDTHNVAEGAGAAATAAVLKEPGINKDKQVAAILSGGNINKILFAEALAE